jgi:hypothetical protein
MRAIAKEATAKWTDAANGLSTEEIVSIMQEALA